MKKNLFLMAFFFFILAHHSSNVSYSQVVSAPGRGHPVQQTPAGRTGAAVPLRQPQQSAVSQPGEQAAVPDGTDDGADSAPAEEPLPTGREFQLVVPGGRERILLFARTATYFMKKKISELKNEAYVKSQQYEIHGDRLLYFENYPERRREDGEPEEHGQAWGNVRILELQKKIQIYGQAAVYYPKRKYMRISGGAHMLDDKEQLEVHGETMERYTNSDTLIVTGYAQLHKKKDGLRITANRLWYNSKTKKLVLVGNVKIIEEKPKTKRIIHGDHVVFTEDAGKRTQNMVITGSGMIREFEEGKLKREIFADSIKYFTQKDDKNKVIIEDALLTGQVNMTLENQRILAGKVVMKKTPEIDTMELTERVYIRDLKTRDEIRGGYAFFDRKKEIMRVLENPWLYIYKEKATIYCDMLKSYRKDKLTIFIGDVEIIQDKRKIYGEKAIFNENEKRISITGDPFVIEKNNITYSEQITVLTDKKEVRLSSRFRGVLIPEDEERGRSGDNGRERDNRGVDGGIPIGDIGGPEIL